MRPRSTGFPHTSVVCLGMIALLLLGQQAVPAAPAPQAATDGTGQTSRVNLAARGAYLLASSFESAVARTADTTYYYDNLTDGNPETTWRPMQQSGAQWIKVIWRYPVQINHVTCRAPKGRNLRAGRVLVREKGQWRETASLQRVANGSMQCDFATVVTTKLMVAIDKAGRNGIELSELEVHGPGSMAPPAVLPPAENVLQDEYAVISDVRITPLEAAPQSCLTVAFKVRVSQPLSRNVCFLLDIADRPVMTHKADFSVATALVEPTPPAKEWTPGRDYALRTILFLPDFTPSGRTPLWIRALDEKGTSWLELRTPEGARTAEFGAMDVPAARRPNEAYDRPPQVSVDMSGGLTGFRVDSVKLPPLFWRYLDTVDFERLYRDGNTGISIHYFIMYNRGLRADPTLRRKFIEELHQNIRNTLRVQPEARFIIGMDLRPGPKWLAQNTSELLVNSFGGYAHPRKGGKPERSVSPPPGTPMNAVNTFSKFSAPSRLPPTRTA